MKPMILKFGGASVAKPHHFLMIADIIIRKSAENPYLVVVVSAMAHATDELLKMAQLVHSDPPRREQDMLVSVGERISIALLAMALSAKGKEAISFTGSQSGIITNEDHTEARIVEVRPLRIKKALDAGKIAIVAGFQGVSRHGEITTLGRGGSDTTAVALAVALGSERVEFYKDVGGIFDRDPKVDPKASLLPLLSYERAFSLSSLGAKVLHARSIELAAKNGVQLHVLPFNPEIQTKGSIVGADAVRNEECLFEVGKI